MLKFLRKNLHKILLILFTVFFPFLILLKKEKFHFCRDLYRKDWALALSIEPLIKDIKKKIIMVKKKNI